MEKSEELYDSCLYNIPKISPKKCLKLRKSGKDICDTSNANLLNLSKKSKKRKSRKDLCDTSNANLLNLSKKSKKLSVIQKYRSAYLKKYIYSKGVKYYRRKKTFVIPVFPVTRRPDNPFDVKNIVNNLRKNEEVGPLRNISSQNQCLSFEEETSYPSLENKVTKTKNWETIRYKYQLDYKEKLKMEREKFWKDYAEKMKMANKQQKIENTRSFYQGLEEPTQYDTAMHRNGPIAPKRKLQLAVDRNSSFKTTTYRHTDEKDKGLKTNLERQPQAAAVSCTSNICEDSITYYHTEDGTNNACESVDLTKDYDNNISIPRSEVQQMRLVRNEGTMFKRGIIRAVERKDIASGNFEYSNEIPKKTRREDYDFSIPFNESNILIKVMAPEGKNPLNVSTQSNSLLQETLQYPTEGKFILNTAKRASHEQEPKADTTRPDHGSESQWIQYIQKILSKTCEPKTEYVNKKPSVTNSRTTNSKPVDTTQYINKTTEPISNELVGQLPVPNTLSSQQPSVIKVNTAAASIPSTTSYYDPVSSGRIKQDRPVIPTQRVIRPKVVHPSPYFRSDLLRNSQYHGQLDDSVGVTLGAPQYPPIAQISDHSTIPQQMEYVYSQPATYHPEYNMLRSRRIPVDISHANLMRQPIFSPYDQPFVQYRNDVDRIPQPLLDPYIQHNMHVPHLTPNVGFLPPRPTAPGIYRYLHSQHVHPVWVYPHMPER